MSRTRHLIVLVLFIAAATSPLFAQTDPVRSQDALVRLNLVVESQRVRFLTSGETLDWRLEMTDQQGQIVFETPFAKGTMLDWPLIDTQGQPAASGVYGYVLTIRGNGAEGLRTHRGQLTVERVSSLYQVSAIGDETTGGTSLTIAAPNAPDATTPEIPASTLRQPLTATFGVQPMISGTGTTGRVTRWIDGPTGAVGNTEMTELNGSLVVGTPAFTGNLQIFGPSNNDVFSGMGPDVTNGPAFNFGYAGSSFGRSAGFFNVRPDASATPPNPSLRFMTGNVERMIVTNMGRVGIGTSGPAARLAVSGSGAFDAVSAPRFDLYNTTAGDGFSQHVTDAGLWQIASINAAATRMVIRSDGNVGIGTTDPLYLLSVAGNAYFSGFVRIGLFGATSTNHACYDAFKTFAQCSSAAEYVPTIDSGPGFPVTADLVSMVPAKTNPYGDTHGPFVVEKSATPCDANLLGFIVKPESGADGVTLNDHYLPLAIYGYFPAKVTLENGAIHRGDAITSSSKAGYGMKATGACRVIGYALEDADHDGTIQVFAHLGEQAVPELIAVRGQVKVLTEENQTLKRDLSALEVRLAAIEQLLKQSGEARARR